MVKDNQLEIWEKRYRAFGISAESLLKDENKLLLAGLTGSVDEIRSAYNHAPNLLTHCDDQKRNLVCYAALSGQVDALAMVLQEFPLLKAEVAIEGRNSIFCCAFASGSKAVIDLIIKHFEIPKGCRDIYVSAARTGSVDAIQAVIDTFGYADKKTLLIEAAKSGSLEALKLMMKYYPEWRSCRDTARGGCLMHWIAESASVEVFGFMLEHYPDFVIRQTTETDNAGNTFILVALNARMFPEFGSILELKLKQATDALNRGEVTSSQYNLLNWYDLSWQFYLEHDESISLHADVLEALCHDENLSQKNRHFIKTNKNVLTVKAFDTKAATLNVDLIRQLLLLAKAEMGNSSRFLKLFKNVDDTLVDKLARFVKHVGIEDRHQVLNARQLAALSVIIFDVEHQGSGATLNMDLILIKKLRATATFHQLQPKPVESVGIDILPENFEVHFDAVKKELRSVALSAEVRRIIDETIMPGIEHLLQHQEQIVQHITQKFGVLYFLDQPNDKLPMHTDHVPSQSPQENRDTLNRLLTNLFGAFYRAHEVGQLVTFFDKLSDGYCLEGRIRDVFNWAAEFSELKSFDEFMRDSVDKYLGYRQYVDGKDENSMTQIVPAADFIMRHLEIPRCKPHSDYAPTGMITREGVAAYLKDMLSYDTGPVRRRLQFLCM